MEHGEIQPERLITHRFPLAEYQQAFELMRDKRELYGKVMLVMA
jgi:threonine dehydrogenase-like Zn-dependent dehydrogenase